MNDTALLLVGHGSRKREGNQEILHFAAQWRQRHPGWRIETCFIEHAEVLLDEGLDRAAHDTRRVLAIPFILNAAGHVKMELPAARGRATPASTSPAPATSAWGASSSPCCAASSIA